MGEIMKKNSIVLAAISILFLLFLYTSDRQNAEAQSRVLETNVLTLVKTIGDDETALPKEYLLASPFSFCVNDKEDIFVYDEYKIKVFDSNGKAKKLIGGRGQGPGEFTIYGATVSISAANYLSVGNIMESFNIFAPDFSFIKKIVFQSYTPYLTLFEKEEFAPVFLVNVYSINQNLRFVAFEGVSLEPDVRIRCELLLYERPDSVITIISAKRPDSYPDATRGGQTVNVPYSSKLWWTPLSKNRAVYINTMYGYETASMNPIYTLNIFSADSYQITNLSFPYKPVKVSDDSKDRALQTAENTKLPKDLKDHIKKVTYLPAVRLLAADGNILFVYTSETNEKNEYVVQVINVDTGKLLSTIWFPALYSAIKNGYVYELKRPRDEYPRIEKYKISPIVYGK